MATTKPTRVVKRATKRASAKRTGRAASDARKAAVSTFYRPAWSTSCTDWKKRIVRRELLEPCPPLFQDQADEALHVFDSLAMVDLGRKPDGDYFTYGETSAPWIRSFVGSVFGCYCDTPGHPDAGRRLIKDFFLLISKKNGKSTIAAGIMLTALILNWREEAEFIILSPTKEVADNSFKPIAAAIKADPELEAMFQVQTHIRTITHRTTRATLKVVAADSATVSGKKAVGVLIDELHEFGKIANASAMFTEATGGLISRPEGFVIYLTTQSDKPPAGVFKEKLEYARKVRDGKIEDPQFYPILYEFPPEMIAAGQHLKPENYYVTNPNMGRSVDEQTLVRKLSEAEQTSKAKLLDVMAKHLNIEVGLALADDNWPGAQFWESAAVKPENVHDLKDIVRRCEVIVGGLDGGGLDDLLGLNVLGREKVTGKWLSWERAIAHPIVLERRKEIADRLRDFEKEGTLIVVEEIGEDIDFVADVFRELNESGLLFMIGMDPNAIGALLDGLLDVGIPREKITGVSQGYKLAGNIKTTERKVTEGVLVHNGTALMNWCVGNAKVKVKGNAIVITKEVSGQAKIDPLMALFCSVAIMEENPPAQNQSYDFSQMQMVG